MQICRLAYWFCFLLLSGTALAAEPTVTSANEEPQVGWLQAPLGQVITVTGIVVEGPFKGFEGGPNLRVQQIEGRYIQQHLQIDLEPPPAKSYAKGAEKSDALPHLEIGKTYELTGYESGEYVGSDDPRDASGRPIQTTARYLRHYFVVNSAREAAPIRYAPRMFEGRKALLAGAAISKQGSSLLVGPDWQVLVHSDKEWPADIEGKEVETFGFYNPDATWRDQPNFARKSFVLLDGESWPARLEDQVGKQVTLRGMARSLNDVWWFNYRGADLYVENMADLPDWTRDNHWRPMVIEGRLERATLPRLDQISLKPDRDVAEYYIVREPTWKPLRGGLLFPEIPVEVE